MTSSSSLASREWLNSNSKLFKACFGEVVGAKILETSVENFVISLLPRIVWIWPLVGCEVPPRSEVYVRGFPQGSCEVEQG